MRFSYECFIAAGSGVFRFSGFMAVEENRERSACFGAGNMGMKRSNGLLKAVSIILFVAVAIYLGVYIVGYFNNPCQSATVSYCTITDSISSAGIIVRSEKLVYGDSDYISTTAVSGKKVAAGQELAVVYSSGADMETAAAIRDLKSEILALEEFINGGDSEAGENESEIKKDIYRISKAVSARDFSDLASVAMEIKSMVISSEVGEAQTRLAELNEELAALGSSAGSGTSAIYAEVSGVFSDELDGFEALAPTDVLSIAPSGLKTIMNRETEKESGAVGKLVTEIDWYYAAVMDTAAISELEVGDSVTMNFGKYYSNDIDMTIAYISSDENGESAVVFRGNTDLSSMLSLRQVSAEMEKASYTGIMIPKKAVHTDGEQTYVYTVTAMKAERKDVNIIYEMTDYYIVTSDTLRDGNEVIVKANDLYDGKILSGT